MNKSLPFPTSEIFVFIVINMPLDGFAPSAFSLQEKRSTPELKGLDPKEGSVLSGHRGALSFLADLTAKGLCPLWGSEGSLPP